MEKSKKNLLVLFLYRKGKIWQNSMVKGGRVMLARSDSAQKIVRRYFPSTLSAHIINKEALKFGYIFMAQINSEWANL